MDAAKRKGGGMRMCNEERDALLLRLRPLWVGPDLDSSLFFFGLWESCVRRSPTRGAAVRTKQPTLLSRASSKLIYPVPSVPSLSPL